MMVNCGWRSSKKQQPVPNYPPEKSSSKVRPRRSQAITIDWSAPSPICWSTPPNIRLLKVRSKYHSPERRSKYAIAAPAWRHPLAVAAYVVLGAGLLVRSFAALRQVDPGFDIESADTIRAVFFGLGADGTVGANKNSIKIIGEATDLYAQGYFVYDSKKAGARTISHLRFGPEPIHSSYLIRRANFVAVHQFGFFERTDVLEPAAPGATLLINSPYPADETWRHIPRQAQQRILDSDLDVHVINAYEVAKGIGLGNRINTIMQTCFFALQGVLPRDEAITRIKDAIRKTYGKRGEAIVRTTNRSMARWVSFRITKAANAMAMSMAGSNQSEVSMR